MAGGKKPYLLGKRTSTQISQRKLKAPVDTIVEDLDGDGSIQANRGDRADRDGQMGRNSHHTVKENPEVFPRSVELSSQILLRKRKDFEFRKRRAGGGMESGDEK